MMECFQCYCFGFYEWTVGNDIYYKVQHIPDRHMPVTVVLEAVVTNSQHSDSGEGSRSPSEGEGSRSPSEGEGSRSPSVGEGSRSPSVATLPSASLCCTKL